MFPSQENQSWIIETGGAVIPKKVEQGIDGLTALERLIYCLWVTDYCMQNAGDLSQARLLYAKYKSDAAALAKKLGLVQTHEMFSLPKAKLETIGLIPCVTRSALITHSCK